MAVALGTAALLVIWLLFIFSAHNPDQRQRKDRHNRSCKGAF
jgi:cbb3-type cytochrome oxidase subunit 3